MIPQKDIELDVALESHIDDYEESDQNIDRLLEIADHKGSLTKLDVGSLENFASEEYDDYKNKTLGIHNETWADLKGIAKTVASGLRSGAIHFGRGVEKAASWLDGSGAMKLRILKRELAETKGDSSGGVIESKALASYFAADSKTDPVDSQIGRLTLYNKSLRVGPLSELMTLGRELAFIFTAPVPKSSEEFHDLTMRAMQLVVTAGGQAAFYSKDILEPKLIGGRSIFAEKKKAVTVTESSIVEDQLSLKLPKIIATFTHDLSKERIKKGIFDDVKAVPILNREQCEELLTQMERLVEELKQLIRVAKTIRNSPTINDVAKYYSVLFKHARGRTSKDQEGNKQTNQVVLDRDDLQRAEWIVQYCSQNSLNHHRLVSYCNLLNSKVFDACHSYIKASMKHFKETGDY